MKARKWTRQGKRRAIVYLVLVGLFALAISKLNIQSAEEYYGGEKTGQAFGVTVTLGIYCDTILTQYDNLDKALQSEEYVPKDGVILKETTYQMAEGDTVFGLLSRAVKENKIQMEYQGADENAYGSVYIKGINHLYEFSCGALSGWMYEVNGEIPDYGCSNYTLKEGDQVAFRYTCDLGKDLGRE